MSYKTLDKRDIKVNVFLLLYKTRPYLYENMPIQINWKFYHQKMKNFQRKNYDIFLFLLKYRLWVLVRTASPRRFYRAPTIYVFE